MNKNFRKAMISTICLLIVGVMSLTGVTYAWFTESNTASVNNIKVNIVDVDGGVEISKDGTNWTYNLDMGVNTDKFVPVSTVGYAGGDVNFFTGTVNPDATKEIYTTATTGNFVKFTLYFRNQNAEDVTVNIAGNGIDENTKTAVTATNGGEKATRIGFLYNGSLAIWAPTTEAAYRGVKAASGIDNYFDATVANDEYLSEVTTVTDWTLTVPAGSDNVQITVYIWLEGQDVDCTNTLGSSVIDVALKFTKQ